MASDSIQFYKIDSGTDLVAVAEVPLFRGVYLRGWYIYEREGKVVILPPHKTYRDPVSGEDRIWSLLQFESKETERRWLEKVEEEYLRWARQDAASSADLEGQISE